MDGNRKTKRKDMGPGSRLAGGYSMIFGDDQLVEVLGGLNLGGRVGVDRVDPLEEVDDDDRIAAAIGRITKHS